MNTSIEKHLEILGKKVTDKVTGIKGVATSVSFDLFGCIQVVVVPKAKAKEGEVETYPNSHWFDIARLKVTSQTPVMSVPDFKFGEVAEGKKGAAEKPSRRY